MPQVELNGNQSLYTQLSQNISDTGSSSDEDEVVRFQSKKLCGNLAPANALPLDNTTFLPLNHLRQFGPSVAQLAPSHTILLDLDGSDAVAILNDGLNSTNMEAEEDESTSGRLIAADGRKKPMGPCRKVCFYLSILSCFMSVAVFLWALPCDNTLTCPASKRGQRGGTEDPETSHNWIRDFEKVEFKSVISVSDGLSGYGKNLIFMYRSDKVFGESPDVPQSQHRHHNGIIALVGSRGQIAWYHQMVDEPNRIDCGLLDVDRNGRPECLVIDEYGQLGCLNPMSGQWIWHISLYQEIYNGSTTTTDKSIRRKAIDLLDFPLILPDIDEDGDGVNDLLLVTSLEQIHHNNFLFVSGANGRPIGKAYSMMKSCEFIHKLNLEPGFDLIFNCINNDTEQTKKISLFELYTLATGGKQLRADKLPTTTIEQHKFYGQRRNTPNQRNIYTSGIADLIVENSGKCPNCTMSMSLVISSNGPTISIIRGNNMYGMVPAVFATKHQINGFVVKFWEWVDNEGNESSSQPGMRDQPESVKIEDDADVQWSFAKDDYRPFPTRSKRDKPAKEDQLKHILKRKMKEHVVLILFNGTAHKVINTSQSDIIQFCHDTTTNGVNSFCQPDINYQENSITIADLDQDGYKELISFYSTFVETDEGEQWKLVTYVQQFRLETELMSLNDT